LETAVTALLVHASENNLNKTAVLALQNQLIVGLSEDKSNNSAGGGQTQSPEGGAPPGYVPAKMQLLYLFMYFHVIFQVGQRILLSAGAR